MDQLPHTKRQDACSTLLVHDAIETQLQYQGERTFSTTCIIGSDLSCGQHPEQHDKKRGHGVSLCMDVASVLFFFVYEVLEAEDIDNSIFSVGLSESTVR
jgi:hypothetical protein